MTPQIVLIRHAQALHNMANTIHDPPLSDLGAQQQCAALRESLRARFAAAAASAASVAVVVSPMRRTLQTAALALDWLLELGVVCEASADWQETSAQPCDTGSPLALLAPAWPHVDFSRLDPAWPCKTGRYAYARGPVLARAAAALDALRRRPEQLVFVVTHSAFLRLAVAGLYFFNADYRVFDFDDAGGTAALRLHQDTCAGGLGLSSTQSFELGSCLPEEAEGRRSQQL